MNSLRPRHRLVLFLDFRVCDVKGQSPLDGDSVNLARDFRYRRPPHMSRVAALDAYQLLVAVDALSSHHRTFYTTVARLTILALPSKGRVGIGYDMDSIRSFNGNHIVMH